jgi:hypothetical protein
MSDQDVAGLSDLEFVESLMHDFGLTRNDSIGDLLDALWDDETSGGDE